MNLDFIEVSKFLQGKDTINFSDLEEDLSFKNGKRYFFDRCRKLAITHNSTLNKITITGSPAYFINGHNFFTNKNDLLEGLGYIRSSLQINIFDFYVDKFEFGTIQEINVAESVFLNNHISIKGMTTQPYYEGKTITGKYFKSPELIIKLYDVNRNIKNKLDKATKTNLSKMYGWNSEKHYIKIENHYKKPRLCFNGREFNLAELLTTGNELMFQNDLINKYKSIMKTKGILIPSNKKDVNAGTIPMIILKRYEDVLGINIEELLKQELKNYPLDLLNAEDKKARMRILKENLNKIQEDKQCEFDITSLLESKKLKPAC